ncbi:zinc finger MYM-type protein 5-like [Eublepharis macularius]|uniref:Zinc finger MYM-type protein 5-like n=1 Tax=Eublepharis macularius TaxID=481883 RepID=A0AA97J5I2_EUBMA|nr:zinc finger MYM-type protein 5-like [Eublepharis macularius]
MRLCFAVSGDSELIYKVKFVCILVASPKLVTVTSTSRQKPSGAQFRKRAKEKEHSAAQTAASMKKWLKNSSDTVVPQQETESESQKVTEDSSGPSCSSAVSSTYTEKETSTECERILQASKLSKDYSDPSTWPAANKIDDKTLYFLTEMVATQAEKYPNCVHFMSTERQNRCLTSSMWYKQLPNGEKAKRSWLIYSKTENALFCAPCKLFLDVVSTSGTLSALQTTGFTNWKKIPEKLPQHESSSVHKVCIVKWKTLLKTIKSCSGVSKALEIAIEAEKQKWTQIIHIVIDAVLFLATNCLPFRGSLENPHTLAMTCTSKKQGNFLNLIALLAKHNSTLKNMLDN